MSDPGAVIKRALDLARSVAQNVSPDFGRVIRKADGGGVDPQPDMDAPQRQLTPQGLYSGAAEAAMQLKQPKGPPQQMIATLKSQKGVKPEEIQRSGIEDAFKDQKSITREQMAQHLHENLPNLTEATERKYGKYSVPGGTNYRENLISADPDDANDHFASNHWQQHNVVAHVRLKDRVKEPATTSKLLNADRPPDGVSKIHINENGSQYFEEHPSWSTPTPGLVVTSAMNEKKAYIKNKYYVTHGLSGRRVTHIPASYAHSMQAAKELGDLTDMWVHPQEDLKSLFLSSPSLREKANSLANLNLDNPPTVPASSNQKKILHVDELQSDWGQAGRDKGFMTPEEREKARAENNLDAAHRAATAVPSGPYVGKTEAWTDLALKRVLHEAAHGNYDRVIWSPGKVHADRYNLAKYASTIRYHKNMKQLTAYDKNRRVIYNQEVEPDKIHEHIGKDAAAKLMDPMSVISGFSHIHSLNTKDLPIGGEGMRKYYDEIVPRRVLALAKEHDPDAKLTVHKDKDRKVNNFPGIDITPKMRESIKRNGFKAYAKGGSVDHTPSDAQKAAGNYRKEHLRVHGLDIAIENRKGSVRSGKDERGHRWKCELPADYGYIKGTEGADGDHVDCYVGPDPSSTHVFIINQQHHRTREFDEHKVMLGYHSEKEAVRDYIKAFSDGKGSLRMGGCKSMSMDAFKHWLKNGNTKKAASHRIVDAALKHIGSMK